MPFQVNFTYPPLLHNPTIYWGMFIPCDTHIQCLNPWLNAWKMQGGGELWGIISLIFTNSWFFQHFDQQTSKTDAVEDMR